MRVALALLTCAVSVVGCGTQAPTPSPEPSSTAATSATPSATPTATGEPTPLPVLTVAAASDLLMSGGLDGRFAAVSGFWYQYFLPCPYQAHLARLAERCGYGVLVDQPLANAFGGNMTIGPEDGLISPAMVTESAASFGLTGGDSPQVLVIIHLADSRLWQCALNERSICQRRPVLDRMVSIDGQDVDPAQFQPNLQTNLSLDAASAAASAAAGGGQVVLVYPLDATAMQDVDPRFAGPGSGVVWYARVITGAPDANGIAAGTDVLIDDASGEVVATLPLKVDAAYNPARLVLDSNSLTLGSIPQPHFSITVDERVVVQGLLDSSSSPLALSPGDYTVKAWAASGAIQSPPDFPECALELTVAAGDDLAWYADFEGAGACTWKQGEWPFN
ncbi:MAG: hypothetical protein QOJ81_2328 [Chloroflexota bacterium]|jgi:hypothetical protein|nr:hypothetical protein [Chloroflexota bacterium]